MIRPGSPSTAAVVGLWLLTRAGMLLATGLFFQGDCATYYRHGRSWLEGAVPYRDYPVEYPPAATLVFAALAVVGSAARFRVAFILLTLLLDALCLVWLLRRRPPEAEPPAAAAALVYTAATAPLFPVLYVRFDLLPATACLIGLIRLERATANPPGPPDARDAIDARDALENRSALIVGASLGLAVALKLYPLLLLPLLWLTWWRWGRAPGGGLGRRAGLLALAGGVAVVALSFVPVWLAGAGRAAFEFLRYQGQRGIQIESSYASLLLLADLVRPFGLGHQMSHSAHDVVGPGVAPLVAVAKLLQPLAVLATTLLAHRRRLPLVPAAAAVLAVAILTANVFSPQFLIWLVPLAAIAVARPGWPGLIPLLGLCALTPVVFPALYPRLVQGAAPAVLVLAARNLLIVWLLVALLRPNQPRRR